MKRILLIIGVLFSTGTPALFGQSALDLDHINTASRILSGSRDCEAAERQLKYVSDATKATAAYILCKARVLDCEGINDSAIVYYRSYLAFGGNDSINQRITYLSEHKQAQFNARYKTASGILLAKVLIRKRFSFAQLASSQLVASKGNIYKRSIDLSTGKSHFIGRSKFMLQTMFGVKLYLKPDNTFFKNALGLDTNNSVSVNPTFCLDAYIGTPYFFCNTKSHAFAAGPEVGVELFRMPELKTKYPVSDDNINPFVSAFVGVYATYYVKQFTFSAGYRHYLKTSIVTEKGAFGMPDRTMAINIDNISFGVGIRLSRNHGSRKYQD